MYLKAVVLLALAGGPCVLAQEDPFPIPESENEPLPVVQTQASAAYSPLTTRESFRYGFDRAFNPGKLLWFGVAAALDQERELPANWGYGSQWYGVRYADRFGRAFIRENMAFGVRTLSGEDPRYELCRDSGIWSRSKHAVVSTFVVRGRNGRLMPAYSRFVSDYATPFIAEQWRPEPFHPSHALGAGTSSIGVAIASNLATEFWPDIRRRFLRH